MLHMEITRDNIFLINMRGKEILERLDNVVEVIDTPQGHEVRVLVKKDVDYYSILSRAVSMYEFVYGNAYTKGYAYEITSRKLDISRVNPKYKSIENDVLALCMYTDAFIPIEGFEEEFAELDGIRCPFMLQVEIYDFAKEELQKKYPTVILHSGRFVYESELDHLAEIELDVTQKTENPKDFRCYRDFIVNNMRQYDFTHSYLPYAFEHVAEERGYNEDDFYELARLLWEKVNLMIDEY